MQSTDKASDGNKTVSFGKPITIPVLIPVEHRSTPACINNPFMVDGKPYKVTALSFKTPHGAVFVEDVDTVDVETIGTALGTHALFPEGASILFIQVIDKKNLKARLWQRGEGVIDFTPEAVCAAGTAAMLLQKIQEHEVAVLMGGHSFYVKWDRNLNDVSLTAAANLY